MTDIYSLPQEFKTQCQDWIASEIGDLTDEMRILSPSEWAEENRYLSPSVTSLPGPYSFRVAPYLREILDCLSPTSPVREVTLMKGVQLGATVGILENAIGYFAGHIKNAPMMMVTADSELAKIRLAQYILPMFRESGISNQICSSDIGNTRKTGKTKDKLEWFGGGFLLLFGARNADKLRSTSIRVLLEDEIDAFPDLVGKDGDPVGLAEDRTAAFEGVRKILRLSTPLLTQKSRIFKFYNEGDQRRFKIPCRYCGEFQELRFSGRDEAGRNYGLVYKTTDDGKLIPGTTKYKCRYCDAHMINEDKDRFLPAGRWEPSVTGVRSERRSYTVSALYSPVGMQTWEKQAEKWLSAWDVKNNQPRDNEILQQFYNNVLGQPYEVRGEGVKLQRVQERRRNYPAGVVPNQKYCIPEAEGPAQVVTCGVDIGARKLDVQTVAWCREGRGYGLEWLRFEGDCNDITSPAWKKLSDLLENRVYTSDDGKKYKVALTLIDSGFATETVYAFCAGYSCGVSPIKGGNAGTAGAMREFKLYESRAGVASYIVTVDIYKDRLASSFRRHWDAAETFQPPGYLNFPKTYADEFFKELIAEQKVLRTDAKSGKTLGYEWRRSGGVANHAWDTLVYNAAALDILAHRVCGEYLGLDFIDWGQFWSLAERERLFLV